MNFRDLAAAPSIGPDATSKRSLSIEIASWRGHSPEMVVEPLRSQIRTAAVIVTLLPR
jgi:hypothetical protein